MHETPTVYQRRIVIGAGVCVVAFMLVGLRLIDVTLLSGPAAGSAIATWPLASFWPATCR